MGLFQTKTPEEIQRKADEKYMKMALKEAEKAFEHHEVPIGCVIVKNKKVLAKERNRRNTMKSAIAHAEVIAISEACKKLHDWRLDDCTLYVTLEPCQMCTGAIIQARVPRVVIGCMNPKAGCAGSVINLLQMEGFTHKADITYGVLEEECSQMLSDFFKSLREYRKENPSDYKARLAEEERDRREHPENYEDEYTDEYSDENVETGINQPSIEEISSDDNSNQLTTENTTSDDLCSEDEKTDAGL